MEEALGAKDVQNKIEQQHSTVVYIGKVLGLVASLLVATGYLYERMYLERFQVVYSVMPQGIYELSLSGFAAVVYFLNGSLLLILLSASFCLFFVGIDMIEKSMKENLLGGDRPVQQGCIERLPGASSKRLSVGKHRRTTMDMVARYLSRNTRTLSRLFMLVVGYVRQNTIYLSCSFWLVRVLFIVMLACIIADYRVSDEANEVMNNALNQDKMSTIWHRGQRTPDVGVMQRCDPQSCVMLNPVSGQSHSVFLKDATGVCWPSTVPGVIKHKSLADLLRSGTCPQPEDSTPLPVVAPRLGIW